jgi:hypothetical protein
MLGEDTEHTTGAGRLHERAGMYIVRQFDLVDRPLCPPAAGRS